LSVVRIWSLSLAQAKGRQRWFQLSQNRRIAAINSSMLAGIAWNRVPWRPAQTVRGACGAAPPCLRPGEAPLAAGLGGLVDQRLPTHVHHSTLQQDLAPIQIDVVPAQRAQLPSAGAKYDRQPRLDPLGLALGLGPVALEAVFAGQASQAGGRSERIESRW
jgi:hypothetical protein